MSEVMTISLSKPRVAGRNKKVKAAISEIKDHVQQHTGESDIRIDNRLNEHLWKDGAANPPGSIDVRVVEQEDHLRLEVPDMEAASPAPRTEQKDETQEQEEETETKDRSFHQLPDDVVETLEDGTIPEGKDALEGVSADELELALKFEKQHQNRKGMKTFIRSNLR